MNSVQWRPWSILALSLFGAGVMLYLTSLHFATGASSFCDLSSEISCSIVNKSVYSEMLGIPVSLFGLAYFAIVPLLLFWKKIKHRITVLFLFTLFSLVFSLYLSGVEFFVLRSVCLFCEFSKVLMLGILILLIPDFRAERLDRQWIAAAVVLGVLMSLASYALQTG